MRKVRISAISFSGRGSTDKNRASLLSLIDRAVLSVPDLVVLPEVCVSLGMSNGVDAAEPVPGPTTNAMAEKAREHDIYIICPIFQRKPDDTIFNSSIIIGKDGEVVGEYHKKHPTIGEIESGVRPGTDTPAFNLSFGKIGMCICYDLNFRDVVEGLVGNGAEIIFFSSMYEGGRQLQGWALDFSVYLVSSHSGGYSTFVDVTGEIINRSDPGYDAIITEELNLDRKILHLDYNSTKFDDIRRKYGAGVKTDVCRPEAIFALESCMPDVTVDDIVKEFELEYLSDYFIRANKVREEALSHDRSYFCKE